MKLLIIVLLTFLSFNIIKADEISVPMSNDKKVMVIDEDLENSLKLFVGHQGFKEARIYQTSDSTYVLEITKSIDNRFSKSRQNMTQKEYEDFCNNVSSKLLNTEKVLKLNQDGRVWLLTSTTAFGLAYGGIVPSVLGVEDGKVFTFLYLTTAATSFIVPYILTQNSNVSYGTSSMTLYGLSAGMGHGSLLYQMGKDNSTFSYDKAMQTYMLLGSIGGGILGYHLSKSMDDGQADLVSDLGAWGFLDGVLLTVAADNWENSNMYKYAMFFTPFVENYIGYEIGRNQFLTRGDAKMIMSTSVTGYLAGVTFGTFTEDFEPTYFCSSVLVGSIIGKWAGVQAVRGKDFSNSQGIYTNLFGLGFGLIGGGVGALMVESSWRAPLILFTIGHFVGTMVGFNLYSQSALVKDHSSIDVDFQINPIGASTLFNNNLKTGNMYMPFMNLNVKF